MDLLVAMSPAGRWKRIAARLGARCVPLDGLRLPAQAGPGLLLADWALLASGPEAALGGLRRRSSDLAVVVIAPRENLADPALERALCAGVDDVVSADAEEDAMVERLRAHLRRLRPEAAPEHALRRGGLRLDLRRREVLAAAKGGWRPLAPLTPKEFELLRLLMEHAGKALAREDLIEMLWGERSAKVNPETLDKHVGTLRRKLGRYGRGLRTVRGVGYCLA